jgi:hypothetical protein
MYHIVFNQYLFYLLLKVAYKIFKIRLSIKYYILSKHTVIQTKYKVITFLISYFHFKINLIYKYT